MKTINLSILIASILFCYTDSYCQQNNSKVSDTHVSIDELSKVMGEWTGSLTYKNYSDGSPFTMPVNLTVSEEEKANELILYYAYPNEPHANSSGKLKITKHGHKLNGHKIISKETLPNGRLQIITEHKGKDNRKKALIQNVYILSANQLTIRKDVQYKKSSETITRNEYTFAR